jgi:hypothetical protein
MARRLLEALFVGCPLHLLLELAHDRLGVAREELDHLVDHLAVVLLGDIANAWGQTALDVVIETGDARMAARLRPLAGPVREDTVEDVERLADLLRIRVRAEIDDPPAMALAREHDPRVLVLDSDGDVGERLVVAQPDVEGRAVPLDEVLLEVERLDLGVGDDHLEIGDPRGQASDPRAGLKVAAHTRPKRLRLADIEHLAPLVAEEVDARFRRQRLQLLLEFRDLSRHGNLG